MFREQPFVKLRLLIEDAAFTPWLAVSTEVEHVGPKRGGITVRYPGRVVVSKDEIFRGKRGSNWLRKGSGKPVGRLTAGAAPDRTLNPTVAPSRLSVSQVRPCGTLGRCRVRDRLLLLLPWLPGGKDRVVTRPPGRRRPAQAQKDDAASFTRDVTTARRRCQPGQQGVIQGRCGAPQILFSLIKSVHLVRSMNSII